MILVVRLLLVIFAAVQVYFFLPSAFRAPILALQSLISGQSVSRIVFIADPQMEGTLQEEIGNKMVFQLFFFFLSI